MNATAIDVPRLIRIATVLFVLFAGCSVFFAYAPTIDALQAQLDVSETILRSDDVAFAEMPHVRMERDELAARYRDLFAQNPEAVFVRELGALVRRHGVALVSSVVARDARDARERSPTDIFTATHVDLEMQGAYPQLLAAIEDLSRGSEIVRVDAPTLKRDAPASPVDATIPVTIFEPTLGANATTAP